MSPPTPARRPWTADEQRKLDDLLKVGKTVVEIALLLQRTPTSIYAQLQRREIKKASRRLEFGLKDTKPLII
jgi:IS30 family transposase